MAWVKLLLLAVLLGSFICLGTTQTTDQPNTTSTTPAPTCSTCQPDDLTTAEPNATASTTEFTTPESTTAEPTANASTTEFTILESTTAEPTANASLTESSTPESTTAEPTANASTTGPTTRESTTAEPTGTAIFTESTTPESTTLIPTTNASTTKSTTLVSTTAEPTTTPPTTESSTLESTTAKPTTTAVTTASTTLESTTAELTTTASKESTTPDPEPGSVVGVVVGVLLAVLIVIVIILVGLIYMKRRRGTPLLLGDQNNFPLKPVETEKDPELTHIGVPPISVEDLPETVKEKSANDNEIFKNEYKSIPESTGAVSKVVSREEFNKEKNRYVNIVAYDETRVKLEPVDGVEGSDYINACYVDGYEKPKKFIAAQGPHDHTVLDFWRMIWEQNCSTLIMLTKCVENGREKCAEYWPEEDTILYNDIIVTLDDVVTCADYVIRKFTMQQCIEGEEDDESIVGERRTLMQFHFLGWPDFGIPKYPHSMLCFIKRIRHMVGSRVEPGNIVVHCSAGVGRTGTYILIDSMLDMMKKEKKVDIYNVIYSLRSQRNLLVQSLVQYVFIHKALMEEYLYGHTEVDVESLRKYYQKLCAKKDNDISGVETEYRTMCSLPVDDTEQWTGNIDANKPKNRLRQVIPFDTNRVKLERLTGQEHSDYINASFIDGYERKKAYIAAQGPLPNTMGDFWRLAWENQCSTIVMLTECEEKGQSVCSKYWPDVGETVNHACLTISVKDQEESEDYTIRDLEVSTTRGSGAKVIRQYHYHGWPELGTPEISASLIKVIGLAHEYQNDIGDSPILVHCSAGSGRTGVFIALSYLLQRAKAEGIVDVFQTVRTLRQQRPHMVQDVAQYQFCYQAMIEYLDFFDDYANFK